MTAHQEKINQDKKQDSMRAGKNDKFGLEHDFYIASVDPQ